jgi:hypothetical protein
VLLALARTEPSSSSPAATISRVTQRPRRWCAVATQCGSSVMRDQPPSRHCSSQNSRSFRDRSAARGLNRDTRWDGILKR